MIVKSFYSKHGKIRPLEVEVKLTPGLPNLQVLGLPDTALKESSLRIKTAITSQGFQWPRAQQVVVNLRPIHIRKHSKGLELAIACALLWETEQIPRADWSHSVFIYGELGLNGEVFSPSDLETLRYSLKDSDVVLCSTEGVLNHSRRVSLSRLSDLSNPTLHPEKSVSENIWFQPKPCPDVFFSREQAELLKLSAISQSSTLLAGPPGSGKTTFAEALHSLLPPPEDQEFYDLRAHHLQFGVELEDRPLISPHHSTPVMSLIGGGLELFPGELAKAHGGLLILDEFLLFPSRVIEALREPLVSKKFKVSRRGQHLEWPAEFQFVATTNLCPCGRLSRERSFRCGYTISKCKSTLEKLSGPMLDRFELILLFEAYRGALHQGQEKVSLKTIQDELTEARIFQKECDFEESDVPEIYQVFESRRRELALKKLAKFLAILDGKSRILSSHWLKAFELSQKPIQTLRKLFG